MKFYIFIFGEYFQKLGKNIYYLDRGMGPKYGPKLAIKKGLQRLTVHAIFTRTMTTTRTLNIRDENGKGIDLAQYEEVVLISGHFDIPRRLKTIKDLKWVNI